MIDPAQIDPARIGDYQLKDLAMAWRAQLARKRRPISPKLRERLEASLPVLLAECRRRHINASWRAFRELSA